MSTMVVGAHADNLSVPFVVKKATCHFLDKIDVFEDTVLFAYGPVLLFLSLLLTKTINCINS